MNSKVYSLFYKKEYLEPFPLYVQPYALRNLLEK